MLLAMPGREPCVTSAVPGWQGRAPFNYPRKSQPCTHREGQQALPPVPGCIEAEEGDAGGPRQAAGQGKDVFQGATERPAGVSPGRGLDVHHQDPGGLFGGCGQLALASSFPSPSSGAHGLWGEGGLGPPKAACAELRSTVLSWEARPGSPPPPRGWGRWDTAAWKTDRVGVGRPPFCMRPKCQRGRCAPRSPVPEVRL